MSEQETSSLNLLASFSEDSMPETSENSLKSSQLTTDKIDYLKQLIEAHFDDEINYKQQELNAIDERIHKAKNILDKLRVCIICKFYSLNGQLNIDDYKNHPAVRQLKCEHLDAVLNHYKPIKEPSPAEQHRVKTDSHFIFNELTTHSKPSPLNDLGEQHTIAVFQTPLHNKQFEIKISVGNVSKYLKSNQQSSTKNDDENNYADQSQNNQDLITHKWMIYIRSANCLRLENYIKKVIFYLHSSYKPCDIVEVKSAPFQLIKRGWGEFPIHVQIHFKDPRNKRIDITHLLKLDWTQTGLQTFGGETTQTVQLIIKPSDLIKANKNEENQINNFDLEENKSLNYIENQILNSENAKIEKEHPIQFDLKRCDSSSGSEIATYSPFTLNQQDRMMSLDLNQQQFITSSFETTKLETKPARSFELSPSSFISTDINNSTLVMNVDNPTNNTMTADTSSNSVCFDELMMNFCSINNNNHQKQTIEQKAFETVKSTESASLDTLLKLRLKPKTPTLTRSSTIPHTISKFVKAAKPQLTTTESNEIIKTINTSNISNNSIACSFTKPIIPSNPINPNAVTLKPSTIVLPKQPNNEMNQIHSANNSNSFMIVTPNKSSSLINNPKLISSTTINTKQLIASIKTVPTDKSNIINSDMNSKRMVIYKVDSSDTMKTKEHAHMSNGFSKLGMALNAINTQKIVSASTINAHDLNSVTHSKKLKISPTQLTRVKSINSNTNNNVPCNNINTHNNELQLDQHFLVNKRKLNENEINNEDQYQSDKSNLNQSLDLVNSSIENAVLLSIKQQRQQQQKQQQQHHQQQNTFSNLTYTVEKLKNSHLDEPNLTFESCLKIALKSYPIIRYATVNGFDWERKFPKYRLPFCAKSVQDYYSWSYAKRKANEWIRALHIKKKCIQMLKAMQNKQSLDDLQIWSTKSVVLWLRSHGYTPLEFQHMSINRQISQFNYVNSFNSIDQLNDYENLLNNESIREELNNEVKIDDENEIIDVVSDTKSNNSKEHLSDKEKNTINEDFQINENENHIGMFEGVKYVKEQLDMLNIKTNRVYLVPKNEQPSETNVHTCDLVESFLFVICKRFAENLVRQTCADIYYDSSKSDKSNQISESTSANSSSGSAVIVPALNALAKPQQDPAKRKNEALKRVLSNTNMQTMASTVTSLSDYQSNSIQYQKFPSSLSVIDVYTTIKRHDIYEFLTNKYMAMPINHQSKTEQLYKNNNNINNNNNKNNNVLIQN